MKSRLNFLLAAIFLLAFDSEAKSTHDSNFFDTVGPAHSVALIKILSGEMCGKEAGCGKLGQNKYSLSTVNIYSGQNILAKSAITSNNLCIGCEYVATFYIKRDKSIVVTVYPIEIIADFKTKERRLLYTNIETMIPFEMSKLQVESICDSKLQCRSQAIYRYIPEKQFINFLKKFR